MLLVPEVKGAWMTPDGAEPTERHRTQCWIESRARERQPGHSLQQCSPAGESGFHVGASCWGSGEACPRLRADLTGWGVKPHAPGIESGWGRGLYHLVLGPERLRSDSYRTLSQGAGAASRSRTRGSSVLPVVNPQQACLQSLAAHSTETSPRYPGVSGGSTSEVSCSTGGGPATLGRG